MTVLPSPNEGPVVLAIDVDIGSDWILRLAQSSPNMLVVDFGSQLTWPTVAETLNANGYAQIASRARECSDTEPSFDILAICNPPTARGKEVISAILVGINPKGSAGVSDHRWIVMWRPRARPTRCGSQSGLSL